MGFPTFKSSKEPYQSFNWNNQGYQINNINNNNPKFKILRLIKNNIKFRYHRELPDNYKLSSITISKDTTGYYVSFSIEFKKLITNSIDKTNFNLDNSIGIDLNTYNIAVSKPMDELMNNISKVKLKHLIDNGATNRKSLKYNKLIKILERKQSRRVLKAKKDKIKLGANHKKTQRKLNKLNKKIINSKNDLYHKISTKLTNRFDMIVVEDLKTKNISKSSKGNEINHGKMVKQKSGLNRAILNASFYQFVAMLQYKQTMLNDKLLVKVDPAYTSQECSKCGCRDKLNRPKQHIFRCVSCGHKANPDVQAASTIFNKGLQSLGVGTTLEDSKIKAFRSETCLEESSHREQEFLLVRKLPPL